VAGRHSCDITILGKSGVSYRYIFPLIFGISREVGVCVNIERQIAMN
jgi:hypothetical protein